MFNFQKTPKTIPEEHKPIITEIIDDRHFSRMAVKRNGERIGDIYYSESSKQWKYHPGADYSYGLASVYSISQDSMRIILSKLTELNEQELNYE